MNTTTPIYGTSTIPIVKDSIKTITELKKKLKMGHVNMTKSQKISLTYHNDIIKKIPRSEIDKHVKFIRNIVPTVDIVGSYRRGSKYSSDIDIVIREPIASAVSKLTEAGYIKAVISSGTKKFSGIVRITKIHRHIDIIFTTSRSYPFAMLYFTGSAKFNIIMRLNAKRNGWKLNEYGLWNGFISIANIKTERDIFNALKIKYVDPENR
jgi:DNA polymerase/3'-5' exonuclease PolX